MAETQLLPVYLVIGADELKRETAVSRLKKRLDASGMADFNYDERDMSKEQEPEDVLSSLNTFPMGAPFRLIVLRGCDRLPKPLSEMLVEYLSAPSASTVCLIIATSLAKSTRLYKAAVKAAPKALIDCTPKKAWELPRQVRSMATAHGKAITQRAAEELVSRLGESTRLLDNELKKLASMVPGDTIDISDVEEHVVRTAEVKPWDILNAVSARDLPRALSLVSLFPSKKDMMLYSLLCTRLRELVYAKALDERGEGGMLASALGLQAWQVKNHVGWARRFRMEELVSALERAVDVELAIKGSADSDVALRTWIVSICSRA